MFLGPVTRSAIAAPHPAPAVDPTDGATYLRAQGAALARAAAAGDLGAGDRAADRMLSLLATLKPSQDADATVAEALSETIGDLTALGRIERALSVYRASGAAVVAALSGEPAELALFRLREAQLRQSVGDIAGARNALDAAVAILRPAAAPVANREALLARALTPKAVLSAASGDLAGAEAALAEHPLAALYARPGRTPASEEEVLYLAARGVVAGLSGRPDPVAAAALKARPGFRSAAAGAARLEIYRTAGAALAEPPGPARQADFIALAARIRTAARAPGAPVWDRPGATDQIAVTLALTQSVLAGRDPAASFDLFQLAARAGPSFDADAMAALAEARDDLERRTIHQVLRLSARRDQLERNDIGRMLATSAAPGGALRHDIAGRQLIREFDRRIEVAKAQLAAGGVRLDGPRLTGLTQLQAVLEPHEAALMIAPAPGGFAYLCVRRDGVSQRLAPADPTRLRVDAKLLQAALTATYAPSEDLDAQFPAAAAVRLYDVLLRPFEPCLKDGDRVLWLSDFGVAGAPLAALLPQAPPKAGVGYDLARADWFVRRHPTAYAGSAAAVVAARTTGRGGAADLDFLGVGDPVLGAGDSALSRLPALPETRPELEASASGFASARLLLQGEATEANLRRQMIGDYRYLSFATHGLIRGELPGLEEPALVLTPTAGGAPEDGLLTAAEIADLDLRAAFVALSACNTANFDPTQMAQDLPALASAFAVAGAPASLATLWPVNSETGQRVVSEVFAGLRADRAPADALAQAQRAFIAAPPGKAYLHPRFWAPFVVLGDGGARPPSKRQTVRLAAIETLTARGGEVLRVETVGGAVAASLMAEPEPNGRRGAALLLAEPGGEERWRTLRPAGAAGRYLGEVGGRLVAGRNERDATGRFIPVLEAFDPATGASLALWRGDRPGAADTFVAAGAPLGADRAAVAVAERPRAPGAASRITVLEIGPQLQPKILFETQAPPGARLSDVTLAPVGQAILVTYSDSAVRPAPGEERPSADEYDDGYCLGLDRTTWAELRDRATGRLLGSTVLPGLQAVAATGDGQRAWLGDSRRANCRAEAKAVVVSLDADLRARDLYADASLGASEVRSLARLPDGRLLAAAAKENVVDYRPPDPAATARADPFALMPFPHTYAAMLVILDAQGRAGPARLLDSGANLYVDDLAIAPGGEIALGGAIGGQAALFRLAP